MTQRVALTESLRDTELFRRTENSIPSPKNINKGLLSVLQIHPNPNQPRKVFNAEKFAELKASIAEKGVLQAICVRPVDDEYEIIWGERRWRASRDLGLDTIPAVIREISEDESYELAVIENLQRADLTPIEEAQALQGMIDRKIVKDQTQLADRLGVNRSTVSRKLALTKLPESVQDYLLSQDNLTETHFKNFSKLPSEAVMLKVAERIIEHSLSVKETDHLIEGILSGTITMDELKHVRTIINPMKEFMVSPKNKKQALCYKHTGSKLLIEIKGAPAGVENSSEVKKAFETLFKSAIKTRVA